ncbi:hypothetical protein [Streptomyces sp. NPDC092903]|uniref:hypothetical protein n=1 Tax=Streptomyces sp. NPDC092903 TaxID=3366017 RepID=UPI0038045E6A
MTEYHWIMSLDIEGGGRATLEGTLPVDEARLTRQEAYNAVLDHMVDHYRLAGARITVVLFTFEPNTLLSGGR